MTYLGQPLKAGQVMFHDAGGSVHAALIQTDGTYSLAKGIPMGQYKITVTTAPGGGIGVPVLLSGSSIADGRRRGQPGPESTGELG